MSAIRVAQSTSAAGPVTIISVTNAPTKASKGKSKQQTTLPFNDQGGSRKRTLTLVNGAEYDISKAGSLPANRDVIEAMRKRILQLEDELENAGRPAKRAKTVAESVAVQGSSTVAPSAAAVKAEEKKKKAILKKIFDRLKKDCKSNDVKFNGGSKTIKSEEILEIVQFQSIFGGKGHVIQPTPDNKPTSTVHIMVFNRDQVADVFGDEMKELKGNRWQAGFMFQKAQKMGLIDVEVASLEVTYSSNMMKCSMKFEVEPVNADFYYDGAW